MAVIENVRNKIFKLSKKYNDIPAERKRLLMDFAQYIANKLNDEKDVNLIFICTHNSRRSIMSQIWAQTGAEYFGISNIVCYSGGTEATAFNTRAVNAVEKAGFKIEKKNNSENPLYLVYYSDIKKPLECFSKIYEDKFNPQKDFAAIMTCSDADANCPVVLGAEARFPIRYDDPKEFDGTEFEEEKYKERFEQIGTEMVFVFDTINKMRSKQ